VASDIDGEPRAGEVTLMGADEVALPETRVEEWGIY
jgi:hypothetical protein